MALRIQVRYLQLPIAWHVGLAVNGPGVNERLAPIVKGVGWEPMADAGCTLFPRLAGGYGPDVTPVELNPFHLRTEFFKLDVSNHAEVLAFLRRAGLWDLRGWHWGKAARISNVWAGFRHINGLLAAPTSPAEMYQLQRHYIELLDLLADRPGELAKRFGPPLQFRDALDAEETNTQALHIEWRHGNPQGVIQPVTVMEMLRATLTWIC